MELEALRGVLRASGAPPGGGQRSAVLQGSAVLRRRRRRQLLQREALEVTVYGRSGERPACGPYKDQEIMWSGHAKATTGLVCATQQLEIEFIWELFSEQHEFILSELH